MSVNKVILVGNLGADPEIKTTQSGVVVGNLRIATSERVKKDGEWVDHTEWHRVTVFGKTAENAGKFLSKGRQVYIEGRLRTRKWTHQDGGDRWSTEIVADQLRFLGSKNDSGGGGSGGYGNSGGGQSGGGSGASNYGGGSGGGSPDGDIPF